MKIEDKYRYIIILAYILLIICSILLFISIWNHLSLNPDIRVGDGMYLLLFAVIILATVIFTLHILEEHKFHIVDEHILKDTVETEKESIEKTIESYLSPYEVDVDEIAENIVPRIDPKESLEDYAERILRNLAKQFEIVQGVFFLKNPKNEKFETLCSYAYTSDTGPAAFKAGEGIPGQVAKNKTLLNLKQLPENYIEIQSALGSAPPGNLLFLPLLLNKETIGIIELATFHEIDNETEWTFKNLSKIIGNAIVTKTKSGGQK